MITLHFAPLTRSIRIMWLLEELDISYRLRPVVFQSKTGRGYAQDTPSGKLPAIEHGDIIVSESGAIVEYLLELYGNGRLEPSVGTPERPLYLEWLHFAEATAASPINMLVGLTVYRADADQYAELIDRLRSSVAQHFDRIEAALSKSPYLVGGSFSAADIMIGFTLWSAKMINLLGDQHPRTSAYLQRLRARPAFSKALDESRRLSLEVDTPSQAQR